MSGHTSVRFLLLSIMVLGMVATVICSCEERISSEHCEEPGHEICSCSNHVCCHSSSAKRDRCMTQAMCHAASGGNGRRRSTQMQERFLRMKRGLAD
uniref:Conotoxin superfamily I4 n=1 Tax=Conus ermineus TaxID=55423 RepID=A0A346CJ26_CONER|nr:conotoxin precursor superfamily I4 [Conus ermineus]